MTDLRYPTARALAWEYGVVSVERRGAMLAPALFVLPDGRQVAPFQVAPWFSEPIAQKLQGLMPRLRGEWPCLPFGFDIDRPGFDEWPASRAADAIDEGHGFGANNDWTLSDDRPEALSLFIDYPQAHPIARMERRITPDPVGPADRHRADRPPSPRLPAADRRSSDFPPACDTGQFRDQARAPRRTWRLSFPATWIPR